MLFLPCSPKLARSAEVTEVTELPKVTKKVTEFRDKISSYKLVSGKKLPKNEKFTPMEVHDACAYR